MDCVAISWRPAASDSVASHGVTVSASRCVGPVSPLMRTGSGVPSTVTRSLRHPVSIRDDAVEGGPTGSPISAMAAGKSMDWPLYQSGVVRAS